MANKKQQRADIIENTIEHYNSDLMYHIQQHVTNEFMETDVDDDFYMTTEGCVYGYFNTDPFLGQNVVDDYMKSNKCGLSIKDVNEVLWEYKEIIEMSYEQKTLPDNIGVMVNCIMFDIANTLSNALDFE